MAKRLRFSPEVRAGAVPLVYARDCGERHVRGADIVATTAPWGAVPGAAQMPRVGPQ